MNWFGRSEVVTNGTDNPLIPKRRGIAARDVKPYAGTPVAVIRELVVERVPGGAIIRADGIAARNGAFDVRLTAVETADAGVLAYSLDAVVPARSSVGTEYVRTVTAAINVTDQDLDGIKTIRVSGVQNAMTARR